MVKFVGAKPNILRGTADGRKETSGVSELSQAWCALRRSFLNEVHGEDSVLKAAERHRRRRKEYLCSLLLLSYYEQPIIRQFTKMTIANKQESSCG